MRTLVFAAMALLSLSAPARAEQAQQSCTQETSTAVEVRAVLADYKPYIDKCVRMRGFVGFRRLQDRIETSYRPGPDLPDPGYIAIYGSPLQEDWLWAYRGGATLIGRLSACNLIDLDPPKPDVIQMIIGECHYRDGPLIHVDVLVPDPSVPRRLYGPAAFKAYGTLAPVPADSVPASTQTAMRAFFEAIRRGDANALKAVLKWSFKDRDDDLAAAVTPSRSAYAFVIGRRSLPAVHYFRTTDNPDNPDTEGCICKISDCGGLWPIAEGDAYPMEAWPYVCVETYANGSIAF